MKNEATYLDHFKKGWASIDLQNCSLWNLLVKDDTRKFERIVFHQNFVKIITFPLLVIIKGQYFSKLSKFVKVATFLLSSMIFFK